MTGTGAPNEFPRGWDLNVALAALLPGLPVRAAAGCPAPLHPSRDLGWTKCATGQFCYRRPRWPFISLLLPLAASERLEQTVGAGGPGHGNGKRGQSALPRRDLRHPAQPIPGAAGRQHALPPRARRCGEGGKAQDRRGCVAMCGGFLSGAAGSSDVLAGSPFFAGAVSSGTMCSAGMNLSSAHGSRLHLRKARQERASS